MLCACCVIQSIIIDTHANDDHSSCRFPIRDKNVNAKLGSETTAVWIDFLVLYVFLYLLQSKAFAFDNGPSQPIGHLIIVVSVIGDDQRVETRVRSRELFGIRTRPVE
jgi:hypothetical protein